MESIYLGRIVAAARTPAGALCALYRVSSRSFPNRMAVADHEKRCIRIVPKPGHEKDVMANPYIAYHCARVVAETAVATNGSQTDPIAEKIEAGMSPRDALVYPLAALDYEKDAYDTPRIAAVVRRGETTGWLGIVRKDGLDVRAFDLAPGECYYVSTYEHNVPNGHYKCAFDAETAEAACDFLLGGGEFARFTNPVTAVCLMETGEGFVGAVKDVTPGNDSR